MNFAPRLKVPPVVLNGWYDFVEPLETCQEPMSHAFGTPEQDKKRILYEGGQKLPTGWITT